MITYHHIGGRSGTFPLPLKGTSFTKDVHLILYDADPDCLKQIEEAKNEGFGKVSVYPFCIADTTREGKFNINFHPTTSSLYEFDSKYENFNRIVNPHYGEYRLGDACALVKTTPIKLHSLTDVLDEIGHQSIDFLSLDVQGAEYDILSGAKKLISENCLGIQLEVEFAKIYKGQASFFEINQLMEDMGFELIELKKIGRYSPASIAIGFRGEGQPLYGEAIYIKQLEKTLEEGCPKQIYKWALFALINKKMGLCIKALENLPKKSLEDDFKNHEFAQLLNNILDHYKKDSNCFLPRISELLSEEMLSGHYKGIPNQSKVFDSARLKINTELKKKYSTQLEKVKQLQRPNDTPIEKLLKSHGLEDVADEMKRNRTNDASCFLKLITPASAIK
jgi:FkbM family methyltransferase